MDPSLDPKQQYGELKRRLRQLIAENEIYKQEIAKVNDRLLRVTRDKAFLLDQLLPYEEDDSSTESELSDSDQDSHHPVPQPQPNTSSVPRRSQPPHAGSTGPEKNNRSGTANAAEKSPPSTKKARPPRPRKPRNSSGGRPGGGDSAGGGGGGPGVGGKSAGGGGTGKSGNGKGGANSAGHHLDYSSTGNGGPVGSAGSKRSASSSSIAQENHYLAGSGGGVSTGGVPKGSHGSQKDSSGPGSYGQAGSVPPFASGPGSGAGSRKSGGGGGGHRKKARLEQQAAAIAGLTAQPVQGGRQQHPSIKSNARHRSSSSSSSSISHQAHLHHGPGGHPQNNVGPGQPHTSSGGRKSGSHSIPPAASTMSQAAASSSIGGTPPGDGIRLKIAHGAVTGPTIASPNASVDTNHGHSGRQYANSSAGGTGVTGSPSVVAPTRPTNHLTPEELERHLAAKQGARKIQSLPPQPASLTLPAELFNEDAFLGDFAAEQIV